MEGWNSSSSPPSISRWNPTKEQISILEGLYKQGIRTPTAEQIQEITEKLRAFGNIEGKNVFYWFQNHKARHRQKQKQERFAYFSRLLHHPPPPPPSPLPPILGVAPPPPPPHPQAGTINVLCSPYNYLSVPPQFTGDVGFYQPQFPPVFHLPGALNGRLPNFGSILKGNGKIAEAAVTEAPSDDHGDASDCTLIESEEELAGDDDLLDKNSTTTTTTTAIFHETLQLFPLHPTGVLEETCRSSLAGTAATPGLPPDSFEGGEDGDEKGEMMCSENNLIVNFLQAPRGQS